MMICKNIMAHLRIIQILSNNMNYVMNQIYFPQIKYIILKTNYKHTRQYIHYSLKIHQMYQTWQIILISILINILLIIQ